VQNARASAHATHRAAPSLATSDPSSHAAARHEPAATHRAYDAAEISSRSISNARNRAPRAGRSSK
jgi:hypothetical protein